MRRDLYALRVNIKEDLQCLLICSNAEEGCGYINDCFIIDGANVGSMMT